MNKFLIVLLCVLACTCVYAESSIAPNYVRQDWFGATFSGSSVTPSRGAFSGSYTVGDSKMAIDSDLESPVSFVVADGNVLTAGLASVSFELESAVIPNGALVSPADLGTGAKLAFALYETTEGSATNFTACVDGKSWVTLSGGSIPADDESYTLTVTFDERDVNARKVQFKVGNVVLTTNSCEWISCSGGLSSVPQINFVGFGNLSSLDGDQLSIVSEVVVIGDGEITVKEEDVQAFKEAIKGTSYSTVDAFLAADAKAAFSDFSSDLKVAEAYALGLVKEDGSGKMSPVDAGAVKVQADAQANVAEGIPVKINVDPPADTGATITYQLEGSADGTNYGPVEGVDPVSDPALIKIPTGKVGKGGGKYRFFKVKTTVTLGNKE